MDEYQDVGPEQYELISALAGREIVAVLADRCVARLPPACSVPSEFRSNGPAIPDSGWVCRHSNNFFSLAIFRITSIM